MSVPGTRSCPSLPLSGGSSGSKAHSQGGMGCSRKKLEWFVRIQLERGAHMIQTLLTPFHTQELPNWPCLSRSSLTKSKGGLRWFEPGLNVQLDLTFSRGCCSEAQPKSQGLECSSRMGTQDDTGCDKYSTLCLFSPSFPPCDSTPINYTAVSAHLLFLAFQPC